MTSKHGKIVTKDGKNSLIGTRIIDPYGVFTFDFLIDGATAWNSFADKEWDFIPDTPKPWEVVEKLKPGTIFKSSGSFSNIRYIKIFGNKCATETGNIFPNTDNSWASNSVIEVVDE